VAYRLARADVRVSVLEARERLGGRAWRVPVGDAFFDAGCEALDHEHTALRKLGEEVGVPVVEAPAWEPEWAELDGPDRELLDEFEREIQALAARVDPDHPEELEAAGALDHQTLAGWLEERGASARVLDAAETRISVASSSVPTAEMSLLAYAVKLAAGAAPTGLRLRFRGGPSALVAGLGERLSRPVRLEAAVVAIDDDGGSVAVRLADGTIERASRVVLALPLTLQRALRFDPPLPEHRSRALAEARYGHVVKEAALFAAPPERGLPNLSRSGVLYLSTEDPRLVIRFAGAGAARTTVDLGRLAGRRPAAQVAVDWSQERWSAGSYLILGPGQLLTWGRRLAAPHGRIHFAGAERSTLRSYMEGAVRGGEEAAAELLGALAG
jgi:monoamine oxidase